MHSTTFINTYLGTYLRLTKIDQIVIPLIVSGLYLIIRSKNNGRFAFTDYSCKTKYSTHDLTACVYVSACSYVFGYMCINARVHVCGVHT